MLNFQEQLKEYIETAFKYENELIYFVAKDKACNYEEIYEVHVSSGRTRIVITDCHGNNIEFYIKTDDFIEWCESPENKKTDWSTVKVDTKVLCFNPHGNVLKRYFSHYKNGIVFVFVHGCTSYSTKNNYGTEWHPNTKLDTDIPNELQSQLNWIKNTGNRPNCTYVMAKTNAGNTLNQNHVDSLLWELSRGDLDIKEYAIIG